MGKATALNGPLVVYGGRNTPGNSATDPDSAVSLFYAGPPGLLDSRGGYNITKAGAVGFAAPGAIEVLNYEPSTIATTSIAAAQAPTAGTPLTLASTTANGITVVSAANQPAPLYPSFNQLPIGACVIDGFPSLNPIGLDGFLGLWNTGTIGMRAVQITSVGNDSTAFFTVAGCDYAGYPVTDRVAGADAGVATTLKTFKAVYSITPSGTLSGSNVSAGQADVYGLPIFAQSWEYLDMYWNGALVTTSTGFVVPDTTSPATSGTGDPRGTYAVQSASNGTKRMVAFVTPSAARLASSPGSMTVALWGVTSF